MKRGPSERMSGRVIADESYYGGKPSNRHGHDPKRHLQGHGRDDKTIIMALIDRQTGEVRSQVIPDVRRDTLRDVIASQADIPNTDLQTDALRGYQLIAGDFASHEFVKHEHREYVRGDVTTNHAESFFSQLQRSLDGTHHAVSRDHLPRYLAEFDFRYSTCKQSDAERMSQMIEQSHGRRLLYQEPCQM